MRTRAGASTDQGRAHMHAVESADAHVDAPLRRRPKGDRSLVKLIPALAGERGLETPSKREMEVSVDGADDCLVVLVEGGPGLVLPHVCLVDVGSTTEPAQRESELLLRRHQHPAVAAARGAVVRQRWRDVVSEDRQKVVKGVDIDSEAAPKLERSQILELSGVVPPRVGAHLLPPCSRRGCCCSHSLLGGASRVASLPPRAYGTQQSRVNRLLSAVGSSRRRRAAQ